MNHIKKFNEEFDPMVGINNLLENPILTVLITAWLMTMASTNGTGDKPDNFEASFKKTKESFIDYCNLMGYTIDKKYLDHRFQELVSKVKEIISPKDENTKLY